MGADSLAFFLGTGAHVGELVILNPDLHPKRLFIQYQAPETIRQAVAMLDLMILDQRPGLGVIFRRPDLVQRLGV